MVKDSGDETVCDIVEGGGAGVESGGGGHYGGACFEEGDDVSCVDEVPRSFAWDDDEFPAFFEEDVSGSEDGGIGGACGDAGEGPHGAGANDHGIEAGGSAGEGDVHGSIAVLDDGIGDAEGAEFFDDDLFGVVAEDEMDFVVSGGDEVEQALEVDGTAGSGGCDDQFHSAGYG